MDCIGYIALNVTIIMNCDFVYKFFAVYLTTLSTPQTAGLYSPVVGSLVNDKLERICKEVIMA
jgi:hypothetical protein